MSGIWRTTGALASDVQGQALANLAKGLVKMAVVGTVMTVLMWPERGRLEALTHSDTAAIIPVSLTLALKMLGAVVAMLAFVAAADYLFQYRQWHERQKMSLRELKEEFKQTEGDPAIKGKMKQVRQVRMRVGLVFQNFNLFPHLAALENIVEAPVTIKGMVRSQA